MHEARTKQSDLPADRFTVHKTCRFIETNLMELAGVHSNAIARFDQGVYVQEILDDIFAKAKIDSLMFRGFVDAARYEDASIDRNLNFVVRKLRGEQLAPSDYMWDEGY